MKKALLLGILFSLVIFFGGCGKSGAGKKNPVTHNTVNGRQLYFTPASNYSNVDSDENNLILVSGQKYDFKAYVDKYDSESGYWESDNEYNCSETLWTIRGIGYFGREGVTSISGETVTITIKCIGKYEWKFKTGTRRHDIFFSCESGREFVNNKNMQ
ncbi:MAG: hypothetical protein LBD46_02840 [Endomicrobium sp.]|jgi:hypothetical protein|nr:hypothetical protein [Endomicrobium sp.]